MVILGLDPGIASTGFGVVEAPGYRAAALASGVIRTTPRTAARRRLATIHGRVGELIAAHGATEAAVEELFVGPDPRGMLLLGQARGAGARRLRRWRASTSREYSVATIKSAVCGYGRAEKARSRAWCAPSSRSTPTRAPSTRPTPSRPPSATRSCPRRRRDRRPRVIAHVTGRVVEREPERARDRRRRRRLRAAAPARAERLAAPGETVTLETYLHVREDALQLFGFADDDERALFRLLLGVSGIGPKLALAIVSAYAPEQLAACHRGPGRGAARVGLGRRPQDRAAHLRRPQGRSARRRRGRRQRQRAAAVAAPACRPGADLERPVLRARVRRCVALGYSLADARPRSTGVEGTDDERVAGGARAPARRGRAMIVTSAWSTRPSRAPEDDGTLRPQRLAEFLGQPRVVGQLVVYLEAARGRGEACDHVLLAGPAGLGKTSLAHIVANEMGSRIHTISGPALERKGDMAAILTALEPRDVLFIDEIHRTPRAIEELLYPAMEDGVIDIVIGSGPGRAHAAPRPRRRSRWSAPPRAPAC